MHFQEMILIIILLLNDFESVTFSGCICNVHLCSDVFLHYGICHGNHHCRYNLLMNENQHIILASLLFVEKYYTERTEKRPTCAPGSGSTGTLTIYTVEFSATGTGSGGTVTKPAARLGIH